MKNPNRLRMQIRTASQSDAEAITEVQIAAIREAYCDLWPADELARIAQTIPADVASVKKGMLPKDVIEKLKQIERLSKRLRSELTP